MMKFQSTSIIIPTYREAENLPTLIQKINEIRKIFSYCELIIVDDNSDDNTEQVMLPLVSQYDWLQFQIRREKCRDLSLSVLHGLKYAKGENILVMDADLSHSPGEIEKLIEILSAHHYVDFVLGSRFLAGAKIDEAWPWLRRLNAGLAKVLAANLVNISDPLSGFFAFRKSLLEKSAPLSPIGYKIGLEILIKTQCKGVVEIPIHFMQRHKGKSKLNIKQQWNYIRHISRLYWFKWCQGKDSYAKRK